MSTPGFDIRIASEERVLVDIKNFQLQPRTITLLFGESGIGKSLIARAIYGLLDPDDFAVTINGEPYSAYLAGPATWEIRRNGFFVFQEPSSHLNPLATLALQLNEGSLAQASANSDILGRLWEGTPAEDIDRLLEVYPKPFRPSGGEKQRMFLVMALKKIAIAFGAQGGARQALFVFDEPTGSLDNRLRDIFLSLLFEQFREHRFTTLLITHDYSMISEITRSHRAVLDHLAFRELSLQRDGLRLNVFRPEVYLTWLESQKPARETPQASTPGRPLLTVESDVRVFGQRLAIAWDPDGRTACPLEIFPGTIVYLKAPSGMGKTTLMKMIMGLIRGERFRMALGDTRITERTPRRFWQRRLWGRKLAMAFQHADEALNPRSTVRETFQGLPTSRTADDIRRSLGEFFDFEIRDDFLDKPVSVLSGGQKQRLNLLRSMVLDTDILLLDEPLNGLDFESTERVLAMLKEKQRSGKGILLVSHNEEIISTLISSECLYHLVPARD